MKIKKKRLDNGLEIILIKNDFNKSVSFQIWVKTGSRNEEYGKTGLSHMLEHMMFKGSRNYGPQEHAQIIQSNGGELNAFTSNDKIVFFENISSDKIEIPIKLEADRFINLSLKEKEFLSERDVVFEERRLRTDNNPYGKAIEMLFALTFIAHPYHWPVIGWASDIEGWNIKDVREYYKRWFRPNNSFIVVSGNFNENEVLSLIDKYFGSWENKPIPQIRISKEPEQKGERFSSIKMDINIPFVFVAYKLPEYGSEDYAALSIIENILTEGESSKIYKELVYKDREALSAGGDIFSFKDYGLFFAYGLQNKDKDIFKLKDKLLFLIENMKNTKIKTRDMEKAKNQLKAALIDKTEKNFSMGMLVGESYFYTGEFDYYEKLFKKYSTITKDEIRSVLDKYFKIENRNVVMILPSEEKNNG